MAPLRRIVLERLIRYYRYLTDVTSKRPVDTITSAQLGAALEVDASQVRKDFGAVGLVGMSRVGYDVCEACRSIRTALGFDLTYSAVLIGTGHLGGALLNYGGFERYGLRIVAAFDADRDKVGQQVAGHTIRSVHQLKSFVEEQSILVAIITTPVEVAQGVADLVVLGGVKAIWNFTPTRLTVPEGVLTRNEHISVGLAQIAYHLKSLEPNRTTAAPASDDESAKACCGASPPTSKWFPVPAAHSATSGDGSSDLHDPSAESPEKHSHDAPMTGEISD